MFLSEKTGFPRSTCVAINRTLGTKDLANSLDLIASAVLASWHDLVPCDDFLSWDDIVASFHLGLWHELVELGWRRLISIAAAATALFIRKIL